MITYDEAVRLVALEIQKLSFPPNDQLVSAFDMGSDWMFEYGNPDSDDVPDGQMGLLVSKHDGSISNFTLPDEHNFKRLDAAKKLPLKGA